ncbi:HTH-type transcriptional repressor YvoA [compost metagenome]|uniref:GntR family transcriptional regulator n=1 Tax=Cupriavidus campinensis TaxID=151783 RepID=A0AAE9L4L2_9BURK|nr:MULTISPECIES: GntR family transcriptional regulator [Cupriavidus]TSP12816.1 GntR family transcriptional regulator [Cupriavidus campinensis]URF06761.1 GntR family transcriptional regulator [Cupriavidus campinensis]CAG2146988.1 HTH-type transcriptional repressor NagR [Cupriavidus campinensis]
MSDAAAQLLSRSREPVYLQLATIFRRQIESGAWRPGEQIPSLEALCREYGVARMTMHHAISQLDAEGLVARSRGRGTFVKAAGRDRRPLALPTSWDQAVAVGDRLSTEAIVESTADVPLPDDLGMPCDGRRAAAYHFLHRAHRLDGRPFAVGEVYIEAAVFAREPEAFRQGASVPVLDRFPGLQVSAARQRLSIVAAGGDAAKALELPVGAPVAELRRFACVDDVIVYYARIEFPTEFVCLDFDLLASRG